MTNKSKDIPVGGTLHSIITGNIIVHADEVYDDDIGLKQSEINKNLSKITISAISEETLNSILTF